MADIPWRLIFNGIHRIICTIGLVVHVTIITYQYLSYDTTTSLYLFMPPIVKSPALSVCFPFIRLLNRTWVVNQYGPKRNVNPELNITLNDVFSYTPSADEAYGSMAFTRDEDTCAFKVLHDQEVRDHFKIDRFTMQGFICYRVQLKHQLKLVSELLLSSVGSGMVYTFAFPTEIENATDYVMPVVHGTNSYPFRSMPYAPKVLHMIATHLNVYSVSSQEISTQFLPFPYVTNCHDYGSFSHSGQLADCYIKSSITRFNMIPHPELKDTERYRSDGHLRILHPIAYNQNRTLWSDMKQLRSNCQQMYNRVDCKSKFYLTKLDSREQWGPWKGLVVRVGQQMSPTIRSVYQPMEDFFTFILLAFSCFGVWLGWSMMDFNPTAIADKFNRPPNSRQQMRQRQPVIITNRNHHHR